MIRNDELTKVNSCLNKARPDEMLFVLRAHDRAAPATIRFWVDQRVRLGLNTANDSQIADAWNCAHEMECQREDEDRQSALKQKQKDQINNWISILEDARKFRFRFSLKRRLLQLTSGPQLHMLPFGDETERR